MGCPKLDGCCQACEERTEEQDFTDSLQTFKTPVFPKIVLGGTLLVTIIGFFAFVLLCAVILG